MGLGRVTGAGGEARAAELVGEERGSFQNRAHRPPTSMSPRDLVRQQTHSHQHQGQHRLQNQRVLRGGEAMEKGLKNLCTRDRQTSASLVLPEEPGGPGTPPRHPGHRGQQAAPAASPASPPPAPPDSETLVFW